MIRSYEHEFVTVYTSAARLSPNRGPLGFVSSDALGFLHSSPRRRGFGIRGEDSALRPARPSDFFARGRATERGSNGEEGAFIFSARGSSGPRNAAGSL